MTSTSAPAARRYRWIICLMLFWVTTANYIDRGVFSNLAPELQKNQFHWTDGQYWYMNMAFSAAYAISLLVVGRLIDVIGLRWGFAFACAFWGLASMSHALVTSITGFFIVRILLGFGEGGNFPAAIKTVAEWFPKRERALATGLFNSGSNVGGVLVPVMLPLIIPFLNGLTLGGHTIGWRGAFLATGLFDLAWIIVWLKVYRKPAEHPSVSASELALIQSEPPDPAIKVPWRKLFQYRQAWAFIAGKFMTDCFWWFYLFVLPIFFQERFGLDPKHRLGPIAIIYVLASVGSVAGGWLSGNFMKIGWSTNKARKVTLLICACLIGPVFIADLSDSKWVAVALIAVAAASHQAWSANLFSLTSDMFPRRMVGSVTGLGGMVGSVGGILLNYGTGVLKDHGFSYLPVFVAASVAYLLALVFIHLLVPNMEPAKIEDLPVA